jgi:putative NADPH-quinone reductase
MPAATRAFLEQVLRPGLAFKAERAGFGPLGMLDGKTARIVVTMGMPAAVHRWWFRTHGLRMLERNVLGLCGIGPIRESLFGMVEAVAPAKRARRLAAREALGRAGR